MEVIAQVLEGLAEAPIVVEGISISSGKACEHLECVVGNDIFGRVEDVHEERDPVTEIIVLVECGRR